MKINNKFIYVAAAGAILAGPSCSSTYDIYPDEYSKVLMFKDGGAQYFTIYSPHQESVYPITIMKNGLDPDAAAQAKVRPMTEAEFAEYLSDSGAGYSYLPTSCYSLGASGTADLSFAGKQGYQTLELKVFPPAVGKFLETYTDLSRTPVIPLVLESPDGTVNPEGSEMFIIPEYTEPTVGFLNGGVHLLDDGDNTYRLEIGLPFESEWNIKARVEYDADVLDYYNANHGTTYGLIPESAVSGLGDVEVFEGDLSKGVDIKIDLSKAGFRDAVPVRITHISSEGFEIGEDKALIAIDNAAPYKVALRTDMIYSNDVYNSDGKGIAGLIDGDYSTHFHTFYGQHDLDDTYGSYLEFTLDNPVQQVGFDFSVRQSTNNGIIKTVRLFAWNGSEWVKFNESDAYGKVLKDVGQTEGFGSFHAPFAFTKFRFAVIEAASGRLSGRTANYWNCAEFVLYAK